MTRYTVALIQDKDGDRISGYHFEVEPLEQEGFEVSAFHICFTTFLRPNNLGETRCLIGWIFTVQNEEDIPFAKRMLLESRLNELEPLVKEIDALRGLKEEI